jgi:cell division protein ZipA
MDLQYALLLIGVLIIGGVALSAYDKLRFDWGRRTKFGLFGLRRRRNTGEAAEHAATALRARRANAHFSGLDHNPSAPHSDTDQKYLRPDAEVGPAVERTADYYLYQELETLEHVAHMPLNLTLGLVDPEAQVETGAHTRRNMPDEKIDFVITLPGKGPVKRNLALGIYKQNEYLLEKPRCIYGLGYKSGLWSDIGTDTEYAQYSDIALALQLVDSRGAAGESELNTFVQLSLKLADELQRPTKLSTSIEEALAAAKVLDAFCNANDVLASVDIVASSKNGFSGRAINQVATQLGMQFGKMNIYHMKNDNQLGCRHQFSLANLFAPGEFNPETMSTLKTQGLTLFMSVPCAYQPVQVFERMIATAKTLCEMLDGKMQDHEKHLLTEQGLAVIRTQIERIAADMQSSGIIPGSETAMRLF